MRLFTLTLLVLAIFSTGLPEMAFAAKSASYLDPKDFGDCAVSRLNEAGGIAALTSRRNSANTFIDLATSKSQMISSTLARLGFIDRKIYVASSMASLPIIDFDSSTARSLINSFSLEQPLFDSYQENVGIDPIDRTDLAEKVKKFQLAMSQMEASKYLSSDIYLSAQQKAASMASPLVAWLLDHPKASVSHWALLEYATDIYNGDLLTALGVIGEMFWQETLHVSDRNKQAVLASKLIPLVSPSTTNPVGDNYHFWQILTAAYLRGGTLLGRIYSPFDSSDPGHRLANKLGLDAADEIFSEIDHRNVTCQLR